MKLKDLIMRCTFDGVSREIGKLYHQFDSEYTQEDYHKSHLLFNRLKEMEFEPCNIVLQVVDGDVSGFYDEETLAEMEKEDPDVWKGAYGLGSLPLQSWLGAEVKSMLSPEAVVANFLCEWGWNSFDEEIIRKNIEERFGGKDAEDTEEDSENAEENDEEKVEVDTKTRCINFIKSFIPAVLPGIAQRLGDSKFEQELVETNCQENGAYCEPIDLKPFGMPLTGIAFFYIYIDGDCMMGVTTEIEGQFGEIVYKWFAPFKELKTKIEANETQNAIVDILVGQVEDYFKE